MRVVTNEARVKRETRIGRIAIYTSLGILALGLIVTVFGQQWGLISEQNIFTFYMVYFGILIVGFAVSRVGMYYANRQISPLRPEAVLRDSLKGLDRKYTLQLFKEPTDYVLIEPGGISAFIFKNQQGKITFKDGKWKHSDNALSRIFGRGDALGNPKQDVDDAVTKIAALIKDKMPTYQVPVRGIVVFSDPKAQLALDPLPFAAVRPDEIKDYLRGAGKLKELPTSIQRQVREALDAPPLVNTENA
jgi:hypothetical protein